MNSPNPEILLLNYLTPASTDCILLFGDNTFKKGLITNEAFTDNLLQAQNNCTNGSWEKSADDIKISFHDGGIQHLIHNKSAGYYFIKDGNKRAYYYALTNPTLINLALPLLSGQEILNEIL